jgi:tetratricopeptide (TPR) repeat protein
VDGRRLTYRHYFSLAWLHSKVEAFESALLCVNEAKNALEPLPRRERVKLQTELFVLTADIYSKQKNYVDAISWRWEAANNFISYTQNAADGSSFEFFVAIAEEYTRADDPQRAIEVYENAVLLKNKAMNNAKREAEKIQDIIDELKHKRITP